VSERATWYKIRNPTYTQAQGRRDLFERARNRHPLTDIHHRLPEPRPEPSGGSAQVMERERSSVLGGDAVFNRSIRWRVWPDGNRISRPTPTGGRGTPSGGRILGRLWQHQLQVPPIVRKATGRSGVAGKGVAKPWEAGKSSQENCKTSIRRFDSDRRLSLQLSSVKTSPKVPILGNEEAVW
jgi:hypothetical protein